MDRASFEAGLRRDGYQTVERRRPAGEIDPDHAHEFDARLLIMEGAMTIAHGGGSHTYRPGEVFELAAGVRHSEQVGPEGVVYLAGRRAAR